MERVVITRISQTKRGRFALFCEQGFLFSVDDETFFTEHLAEGDCLDAGRLEELRLKSDTRRAKDKALMYLSLREHGSGELYEKLCRSFDEHSAAAAVAKMDELGMLNDEEFARRTAAWLQKRNKSRSQIARQLAEKGVDRDLIDQVLEELYETAEEQAPDEAPGPDAAAALRIVEKHYGAKLAAGKKQNVLAALARRGFCAADSRWAVQRWLEEHPADQDTPDDW